MLKFPVIAEVDPDERGRTSTMTDEDEPMAIDDGELMAIDEGDSIMTDDGESMATGEGESASRW
jgi:hypothetical protein